eukprot:COSAG06_NODE_274_length_18646_cov_21.468539_7_plen_98_part_00
MKQIAKWLGCGAVLTYSIAKLVVWYTQYIHILCGGRVPVQVLTQRITIQVSGIITLHLYHNTVTGGIRPYAPRQTQYDTWSGGIHGPGARAYMCHVV